MMNSPRRVQKAWEGFLRRRIRSVLGSIPGHIDRRRRGEPGLPLPGHQTPNWILLPIWLDQAWAEERGERLPKGVLTEILWGQYALFLCLRIQDDLLDRQRDDLRLLLVADHFLLQSLQAFQRFPELEQQFWVLYRDCVRDTVNGALEVGRLEKEAGGFTAEHLGLYARVGSAFKVGVAALSRLYGRDRESAWLSPFQDQLTMFGQIVDDLEDLAPDLKDGRFTWVANTMLAAEQGESISLDERARRLGEGLLRPERGAAVVGELRRTVCAAAAKVPEAAPRPIHDLVQRLSAVPDELERSLHQARVRWVFGEAVARG